MDLPDWIVFFERRFPSANMVLLRTEPPVLIDTGFGSDVDETERLLRRSAGVRPQDVGLILNTHLHSDHVGGNAAFQQKYKTPIAAHRREAERMNNREPGVCDAAWLKQPVEPFLVDMPLEAGERIRPGQVLLQVMATPGHTADHISFLLPDEDILICGDAVHADDVAWIDVARRGVGALEEALTTIRELQQRPVKWAASGHGPALRKPQKAFSRAAERYERWLADPGNAGWHACKRIFAYRLMLLDGLPEEKLTDDLISSPWLQSFSTNVFHTSAESFAVDLVEEMIRSGAAAWRDGRLVALAPHRPPSKEWMSTVQSVGG